MRDAIQRLLSESIAEYCRETGTPAYWKNPEVGFADARHPLMRALKQAAYSGHYLPHEVLDNPTAVLSYYLPFREEVGTSNRGTSRSSALWAASYRESNTLATRLNQRLISAIEYWGYRARVPENGGLIPGILKSRWSQKHIAWLAGHGTFGLHTMLITNKHGCCGRFYSLVTDIPVQPDAPVTQENCLYKRDGSCGVCVSRCVSGALREGSFDREQCYAMCLENLREPHTTDVCGKCLVDLPCTFSCP